MALCILLLMRVASITWASGRGLGPGNLNLFWAPNGTCLSAQCHVTGPKKVSISRARPPTTCPCPHQKQYARGHKNHRYINSYYPPVRDYEFGYRVRDRIKSLSMDYCKVHTSAVFFCWALHPFVFREHLMYTYVLYYNWTMYVYRIRKVYFLDSMFLYFKRTVEAGLIYVYLPSAYFFISKTDVNKSAICTHTHNSIILMWTENINIFNLSKSSLFYIFAVNLKFLG